MKEKRIRILGWLRWTLLGAAILLCGAAPIQAGEIGKTVDKTNVAQYKDLLPPALYKAVERGDYILPTANLTFPFKLPEKFLAASEKNAGKFDVDKEGNLIDKATGKFPAHNFYGLPFPHIDTKDLNAAVKIIWNFKFMRYRAMGAHTSGIVYWVDEKKGVERVYRMDGQGSHYLYYYGREPGKEVDNPSGFLYQYMSCYEAPMSVKGMNTMNWEYYDDRDNTVFAYVPVIRRVRQSSGASRSDSTMGGDSWNDLTNMWDGKNSSMAWKVVGEQKILVAFTDINKGQATEEPDGTFVRRMPEKKFGYNTPGWKGAPWAITTAKWVPRDCWIVEQMPKDPYYNWGLHINYVDKETFSIWHKEVYDKAGQFQVWMIAPRSYCELPDGRNDIGEVDAYVMTNEKVRHTTMANVEAPHHLYYPPSRLGPGYFTLSNFLKISK